MKPIPPTKTVDGSIRIFLFGGSALVMGYENESLADYISKNLPKNYQVYNFGTIASVSSQSMALMSSLVVKYKPDIVIQYDGYNDIIGPLDFDPRPSYPYNYLVEERAFLSAIDIANGKLPLPVILSSILRKSVAISSLLNFKQVNPFDNLSSLRESVGYRTQKWEDEISDSYLENISFPCQITDSFHFRYIHFFQPSLYYANAGNKLVTERIGSSNDYRISYAARQRNKIMSKRILNKSDCSSYDLSTFMNDDSDKFIDTVHINSEGNRKIASFIAGKIVNQ